MKKIFYTLCLMALSVTTINAQNLVKLGVRFSQDTSKKLNDVVGFNAATTDYTVNLSIGQTIIPKVEATPEAGHNVEITQATSITGTEAERTAKVKVYGTSGEKTYHVTFVVSDNFIEGFTEEGGFNDYTLDGDFSHGEQLGIRSCRTANNANGAWWNITLQNAGKLTFYLTKDKDGSGVSNLLSTLKIKRKTAEWATLVNYVASTYMFPANGVWTKVEVDIEVNEPVTVQFEVTKTGTSRDFRFDDVVITPYGLGTSVSSTEKEDETSIRTHNGTIYIDGTKSASEEYVIYNLSGQIEKQGYYSGSIAIPVEKGLYIIKTTSKTEKLLVQ